MKTDKGQSREFRDFDSAMRKILSVSHDELRRREEKWKTQRKARKRNRGGTNAKKARS